MKNVLVYMNEDHLKNVDDSTSYVVRTLRSKYSDEFNVQVSTEANPELAKDANIIFCRFEIPIKSDFLNALSKYDDGTRTFINPPETKLNYVDKSYLERFVGMDVMPETIISASPSDLAYFMQQTKPRVISKPLDENGGKGISKVEVNGQSISELEEIARGLTNEGQKKMILQRFIEGVEQCGDKRINVLFGEPVSAMLRLPKKGSYLCNLSAGGNMVKTTITKQDRKILEQTQEFIEEIGATWAGVDVIGQYLGEINVSSPGNLYEADFLNGNSNGVEALVKHLRQ